MVDLLSHGEGNGESSPKYGTKPVTAALLHTAVLHLGAASWEVFGRIAFPSAALTKLIKNILGILSPYSGSHIYLRLFPPLGGVVSAEVRNLPPSSCHSAELWI